MRVINLLKSGLLLVCLLFTLGVASSVTLSAQEHHIHFRRIGLEDGLSQITVKTIIQDKEGYMWFGTQDGLNKYDGYQFTTYFQDPDDPKTLSNNFISQLSEDNSGNIWIATWGYGLDKYDPRTGIFEHYYHDPADSSSLSDNKLRAVYADSKGYIWVGSEMGAQRLDPASGAFTHYFHSPGNLNSITASTVRCILEDRKGNIWIGTEKGLNRLEPKTGTITRYLPGAPGSGSISDTYIHCLCEDRNGMLWVGTKKGLNAFDPVINRFEHYFHQRNNPASLTQNEVKAILEDCRGDLWVGTTQGLNRLNPIKGTFTHYLHNDYLPTSISSDGIDCIYEDRGGVLWVGTTHGGLNTFSPGLEKFKHYIHDPGNPNSLISNSAKAISKDTFGYLWVGSGAEGLSRCDTKTGLVKHYRHEPGVPGSLANNSIFAITSDSNGRLWVGTKNGLDRKEPDSESFIHYRHDPEKPGSLSVNSVAYVLVDRGGTLWVCTLGGGLARYNPGQDNFTHYKYKENDKDSLGCNKIFTIFEDSKGILWLGSTGGLVKFHRNSGKFQIYKHIAGKKNSLSNNTVMSIHEDQSGILWIGTLSGGLNRFDPQAEHFTPFRKKDGLPSDCIYCIIEDRSRNLWLSTNKGLSKYNPKAKTFTNYNYMDGLQSNEFNASSAFKSAGGEIFFGGTNGITAFFPHQLKKNSHKPLVVLTAFRKFNKKVILDTPLGEINELKLSYKDYIFSFEFAALDYLSPRNNKYAYKMEGLDKEWIHTDATRRFATYTTLPPGHYVFRVIGSNNDGLWNKLGTSINIWIKPPIWKKTWFLVLVILAFLIVALSFYGIRFNALKKRNKKLNTANINLNRQILDRELAEKALDETRKYLNGVIESMPAILIALSHTGLVTHWNPSAEKMTAIRAKDAIGKELWEIFPFFSKYRKKAATVFENSRAMELQKDTIKSKDRKYYVNISLFPLTSSGLTDLVFMLDDITEAEKQEQQLRQVQKMDTVGTLAGGLAHDFNNVLGGIIGGLSILRLKLKPDDMKDPEISEYLDDMNESAGRASDLVKQLMSLSRQQELSLTPLDLNLTLKHVLKICNTTFEKSIELKVKFPDEPARIHGDSTQIHQVILNMAVNSSHAMTIMRGHNAKWGGKLQFSLRRIFADPAFKLEHPDALEPHYWALSITDDGVGIRSKDIPNIFDPFYTTKAKGTGTGLGLAMAYGIIRQHYGFINVYSEEGKGTRFTIYLPESKAEMLIQETQKAETKPVQHHGDGLILVVDDEPIMRKIAQRALQTCGFEVMLANDGHEGVELFEKHHEKIKLVVLDMLMPRKSGKEAFQEMRKIDQNLKVLLCSGLKKDHRIAEIVEHENTTFIEKPYTFVQLTNEVFKLLEEK
ncbi:MAG: response regulator [bacterium]|nr:response regulator [bacterium]